MKEKTFQQAVGFSVKDTIALFFLYETKESSKYPREVYFNFLETFPGRTVGYEYVARVAKNLEGEGALDSYTEGRKVRYQITEIGLNRLQRYRELYESRFSEIVLVLDRFYYDLTKNGEKPPKPSHELPEAFRSYFSKLISIKDIVRFMVFNIAQTRSTFSMADVEKQLLDRYGWAPSNGYLYNVSWELEELEYIVGRWPDERRTKRELKGTDLGNEFYEVIKESLTHQITMNRRYVHYMLRFCQNPERTAEIK
ncbi:hypothetical protein [Kurthia senegalensis]|uniref:hypothetical protein n=1 Tax=Kurthia senegalensis TaxID=1033740 RepID=UPI0002897CDA|nr:hypothetical protein [Kurthia senegalensis]